MQQALPNERRKERIRSIRLRVQVENVRPRKDVVLGPFESAIVVSGHEVPQVQPLVNESVLQPRKKVDASVPDIRYDPGIAHGDQPVGGVGVSLVIHCSLDLHSEQPAQPRIQHLNIIVCREHISRRKTGLTQKIDQ